MLNGIAPILIFQIPKILPIPTAVASLLGMSTANPLTIPGIPIPLYLDEKLTGLYVTGDTGGLTIETDFQKNFKTGEMEPDQRGVENTVTVSLLASKDSIILSVLIALLDTLFAQLITTDYSVSYINGSTLVLGGLLSGFDKQVGTDDDLIRLTLHLIKKKQATPATPDPGLKVAAKVAGSAAGPGGT